MAEPRYLRPEQLAALHRLIDEVRDGWAELRFIDPTSERERWVQQRQRLANLEEEIERLWPA
jgi:hypothetical protein